MIDGAQGAPDEFEVGVGLRIYRPTPTSMLKRCYLSPG